MVTKSCKVLSPIAGLFSILAMLVAMPPALLAQTFYGSIVGTVTDTSGAIVTGASLTLTNIGTNDRITATTDPAGDYRFINLVPANYRLDVEMSGFKHTTRQPITVAVENAVRIDVAMEVGASTETVEVTSQTPLLQTESGEVSDSVEGERVQQIPLNGRNTMNLLTLTPGVVAAAPSGASALNMGTHTGNAVWSDYSIAGGFAGAEALYIDGATLNQLGGNTIAFIPTQDAIQEFRIVSSGVSPEFGRFGGGVINMTTKSGSNQWHGSVYEYFRNKVLNANDFFDAGAGVPRGLWNQDQYGATLGSPIVKNKFFSFFSWEGFRLLQGYPNRTWVPTDAMKSGKFYQSAIRDPLAAQLGRSGCVTTGTDARGTYSQISPACFDPTATAMLNMKYWPEANSSIPGANYNYVSTPVPSTGNNANQFTERVDYNLLDKHRFFARYTYWGQVDIPYNQLGNFTKNSFSHNRSIQGVLGDTYTVNPSTILDVRLAYDRQFTDNQPATLGQDLSSLGGQWPSLQKEFTEKYLPGPHVLSTHEISGSLYPFFGMNVFSAARTNTYDFDASLTRIVGSHSLKFGGEIRLSDQNAPGFTLAGSGEFLFLGFPWLSGDGFADFLFGVPGQATATTLQPSATYNWYQGYYGGDVWQASHKLTVNFGLRWELPGPIDERHDLNTVLLPTTTDPVTGTYGTMALVNTKLYPSRSVVDARKDLFAPRVGFAYRITDADVVRGGYGITYLPPDIAAAVMASSSPVNSANSTWSNLPFGNTQSGGPLLTLSNPFPTQYYPSGIYTPPGRSNPEWTKILLNQALSGPVPHQPYAYTQQWNVTVAHQFRGDVMFELGYAGTTSANLPTSLDLDALPRQYWTPAGATLANTPYGTNYTNVTNANAGVGSANYNSGFIKVEKRFRSGGVLAGNYTWAKSMADAESGAGGGSLVSSQPSQGNYVSYVAQDSSSKAVLRQGEYSLASFDIRQRMVISYVLNLPFGAGQRYARFEGLAGALVSGWTVNGITDVQNGFPLPMTQNSGSSTLNSYGYGVRPNFLAGCSPVIHGSGKNRLNKWFNTSCYSPAPDFSLGNEPRIDPQVRTDGVANWDVSLLKSTKIKENVNLQFRAEFFNAFNHPSFAAPDNVATDAGFGQVSSQFNNPRLIQFSLRLNF